MEVSVSILDINKENIFEQTNELEKAGVRSFHIDVMDGKFVPNNNLEEMYLKAKRLEQVSLMRKEVHLMTLDLKSHIDKYAELDINSITFHVEALSSPEEVFEIINYIKSYEIQAGISFKPETKVEDISKYLPYVSKVLVMSVEPGKGGQKFIPETIDKLKKLREIFDENNYSALIEVDGGINNVTSKFLSLYNVDTAIVGSYITKNSNKNYKKLVDSILGGNTMLVNTKEMLEKAAKEGYAIGAFNFSNMENLQAIMEAAEETKSPVIIQTSSSAIKYMGMDYILGMVEAAGKNSNIPFALHLDHGPDFETAKMAIDAGYSSVMIDASSMPYEENVRVTKEVVEYAHPRGVTVEAEIGRLAGVEDEVSVEEHEAIYTSPEEAKKFAEETGVDSLAIAIGTSHGAYKFKGDAKLRYDILEETVKLIPNVPIVLHGASTVIPELVEMCNKYGGDIPGAKGTPHAMLKEAAEKGVSKINVDTDLRLAVTAEVRKMFSEKPSTFNPRDYLGASREKMKEVVKNKMENVFMSAGKA